MTDWVPSKNLLETEVVAACAVTGVSCDTGTGYMTVDGSGNLWLWEWPGNQFVVRRTGGGAEPAKVLSKLAKHFGCIFYHEWAGVVIDENGERQATDQEWADKPF